VDLKLNFIAIHLNTWIEINLTTSKQGLKMKIIQQRSIIEVRKHTFPLNLAVARREACTQIVREEQWASRVGGGGGGRPALLGLQSR
jgi:hypothetical protein